MKANPIDTTSKILTLLSEPLLTKDTWFANTSKPGSAIDIKKPKISPAMMSIHNDLLFARVFPVKPPKGTIPMSTPSKKRVNPTTTNKLPIKNRMNNTVGNGTINKCKKVTKISIGITELLTSLIFSPMMLNELPPMFSL